MRPSIRCRLIALVRAQWAGLLALFLVIAGGTAYAANTIGSSDIINESILSQDVKNGALKSGDLASNSIFSSNVRDDTLPNGGLTGIDIAESTLGQVPSASVGGLGRQGAELAVCDPETSEFVFCKNSQLFDVPSGGARALVLARLSGASSSGSGRCRLGTSSIGVMPDTDQIVSGLENTTLVGITDPLPPGPTDFAVDCSETGGEMIYGELAVSAVLISPS